MIGAVKGGPKAQGNIHSQKPGVDLTGTVEQSTDQYGRPGNGNRGRSEKATGGKLMEDLKAVVADAEEVKATSLIF